MRVEDLTKFEGECPNIVVFGTYMDIRVPLTKKWKKIINERGDKPNTYHNCLISYISEQIALSGFNMKSIGNLLIKGIVFNKNDYYKYNDVGGFPAAINDLGYWDKMFQDVVFPKAKGILFMKGRIKFHREDGTIGESPGCGSILVAFGEENAETLRSSNIEGRYIQVNQEPCNTHVDWEQRRYEMAKTMLPITSVSGRGPHGELILETCDKAAELAVIYADALIKELKWNQQYMLILRMIIDFMDFLYLKLRL